MYHITVRYRFCGLRIVLLHEQSFLGTDISCTFWHLGPQVGCGICDRSLEGIASFKKNSLPTGPASKLPPPEIILLLSRRYEGHSCTGLIKPSGFCAL